MFRLTNTASQVLEAPSYYKQTETQAIHTFIPTEQWTNTEEWISTQTQTHKERGSTTTNKVTNGSPSGESDTLISILKSTVHLVCLCFFLAEKTAKDYSSTTCLYVYQLSNIFFFFIKTFYLHHQHDRIERDHGHDSILEWRRHHKLPHSVLKTQLVLGHVACQGPGVNGKIYTSSLQRHKKRFSLVDFSFSSGYDLSTFPLSGSDGLILTSFFSKL